MHLLFRNHIIAKKLYNLPQNSLTFLNSLRYFTHFKYKYLNPSTKDNTICLPEFINSNVRQIKRSFKTSNCHLKGIENYTSFDFMDGFVYKIRRYFGYSSVPRYRLQNTSVYVYESCSDAINIEKFIKFLNLPDTYLSWFLITQIHVWMCMTRAMSEGKEGRLMRNEIVARMWEDCQTRLKKLTHLPPKVQRQAIEDLLHQFQAAIFAYDEGFLTDDKTLAAAIWRTLYMYEEVEPQTIETMVNYMRTQLEHLQTIGTETFFLDGKILWKDFPPLYP